MLWRRLARSESVKVKAETDLRKSLRVESETGKMTSFSNRKKKKKSSSTPTSSSRDLVHASSSSLGEKEHRMQQRETIRRALVTADSVRSLVSCASVDTGGGSSMSLSQFFAEQGGGLDCTDSMAVIQSWNRLKQRIPRLPENLGEQIIRQLLELDSTTLEKLFQESSLGAKRLDELSKTIIQVIEAMTCVLGPDLDEFADDLTDLRSQLVSEGFDDDLLENFGRAVSGGIADAVEGHPDASIAYVYTEEVEKSWKKVFDYMAKENHKNE